MTEPEKARAIKNLMRNIKYRATSPPAVDEWKLFNGPWYGHTIVLTTGTHTLPLIINGVAGRYNRGLWEPA